MGKAKIQMYSTQHDPLYGKPDKELGISNIGVMVFLAADGFHRIRRVSTNHPIPNALAQYQILIVLLHSAGTLLLQYMGAADKIGNLVNHGSNFWHLGIQQAKASSKPYHQGCTVHEVTGERLSAFRISPTSASLGVLPLEFSNARTESQKKPFLASVIPSQKLFYVLRYLCMKPLSTLPSLRNN